MKNRFDNIDCMIGMAEYEDSHFDLAIVDPPYGIGNWTSESRKAKPYNIKWEVEWNELTPQKEYFDELYRVSKNQIIWGANYYREFIESGGAIIWDKGNGSDIGSHCEIASCSLQNRVTKYYYQHIGFITNDKSIKIHPCQKPIALYKWLLTKYAKQGDLILDTHVGSASSLIACEDMGFEYVGFELDKDYYNSAQKRLKQFRSQLKLAI